MTSRSIIRICYIYANGRHLAKVEDGEVYYYHLDPLGSPVVITNSSGDKVKDYHYYPFGGISEETGSLTNTHKFTGKELDSETGLGLYYYGARYYDPGIGRFITPDPVLQGTLPGSALLEPQRLNPYAYAGNNPLRNIDIGGQYYIVTTGDEILAYRYPVATAYMLAAASFTKYSPAVLAARKYLAGDPRISNTAIAKDAALTFVRLGKMFGGLFKASARTVETMSKVESIGKKGYTALGASGLIKEAQRDVILFKMAGALGYGRQSITGSGVMYTHLSRTDLEAKLDQLVRVYEIIQKGEYSKEWAEEHKIELEIYQREKLE